MTTPFGMPEEEEEKGLVGSLTGTPASAPQPLEAPQNPADLLAPAQEQDPDLLPAGVGETPTPDEVPTEETEEEATPEETEEETSLFSLTDTLMAPVRGVEEFARDLYGLVDFVGFDSLPDLSDDRLLGESSTAVGAFLTESVNFALGFIPVAGALGKVGKVGKFVNVTKAAEQAAQAAGKTKTAFGLRWGRDAAAGAVVDFAFYDAQEERVSNMLTQIPALSNPVTEYLAADEGDTETEGRIKQMIEGGIMGLGTDAFLTGLKAFRRLGRVKEAGGTPRQMEEALDDMQDELKSAVLDPTGKAEVAPMNSAPTPPEAVNARAYYENRPLSEQERKIMDCEC